MGCWQSFKAEFGSTMFGIEDPPKGVLDMDASFHIGKGFLSWVGLVKFVTFGFAVGVLTNAFFQAKEPSFYPSFITPWGVFLCILQLFGSFTLTACVSTGYDPRKTNVAVKLTWLLYSIAGVMGCCICGLYWSLVWEPKNGITFNNTMTHGGTLVVVLIQGIFLDRVPVRLKHILGSSMVALIFDGWLALHNTVIRYNPLDDDDDDALYDAMKWRENTLDAVIKTILILFVAVPFFTLILWLTSLPRRRYLTAPKGSAEETARIINDEVV